MVQFAASSKQCQQMNVLFVRYGHVMNSMAAGLLFTSPVVVSGLFLQRAERPLMTLMHFNAHLDLVEVMFGGFKHETTLSPTWAPN